MARWNFADKILEMKKKKSSKRDNIVIGYLKEVRDEISQVSWPSRKEAINMTLIVIGVSLAVGAYLGALDYAFTWLMGLII